MFALVLYQTRKVDTENNFQMLLFHKVDTGDFFYIRT
jgi:hypothetical protein